MTQSSLPVPSLWAATAAAAPQTPVLDGHITVDVAVIGAGFAGLSAALHVAEAGRSVAVLEAQEVGHGGAGRNNGQVIPSLTRSDPADLCRRFGTEPGNRLARLVAGSAAFTFDLIRRHGIDAQARQDGWLQPAHSPGRAGLSRRRYEQWKELGSDVALLDGAQVQDLTGATGYHAAWLAHDGGHVNPLGLARGLAGAALTAGAQVYTRSPVLTVTAQGGGWRLSTPQGSVTAGRVLVATDSYADALFPDLRRSMVPVTFYQIATDPLPPDLLAQVLGKGHALSDTHADLYFFRPTVDGRIVSGGALISQVNWQPRLDRRVEQRLRDVFPAFAGRDIRFGYRWEGTIAFTPDFLPHLHELAPGVVTITGYNGRGVALATASGRVLAQAALGHGLDDLDIPLTPVRPVPFQGLVRRFAGLELLRYRLRDRREVSL